MSMILDNLTPDAAKREIELLREVIAAKDALIAELRKSQPVYVPYPVYPTWLTWPATYPAPTWGQPSYPWKYTSDQWAVTTAATTTGISIDTDGNVRRFENDVEITQ